MILILSQAKYPHEVIDVCHKHQSYISSSIETTGITLSADLDKTTDVIIMCHY